ncbi:hypothetical protein P9112_006415 [Eukaryota sp. TZLM1-RC]
MKLHYHKLPTTSDDVSFGLQQETHLLRLVYLLIILATSVIILLLVILLKPNPPENPICHQILGVIDSLNTMDIETDDSILSSVERVSTVENRIIQALQNRLVLVNPQDYFTIGETNYDEEQVGTYNGCVEAQDCRRCFEVNAMFTDVGSLLVECLNQYNEFNWDTFDACIDVAFEGTDINVGYTVCSVYVNELGRICVPILKYQSRPFIWNQDPFFFCFNPEFDATELKRVTEFRKEYVEECAKNDVKVDR